MPKAEWHCLVEVVFNHYSVGARFCPYFHAQVLLVSNIFRCTQGGMLLLYLFGISKNPWHFSPSPQRRRLVHQLHSGMSRHHQVSYIIFT